MSNEITELLVRNKWTTRNKISFIPNGVSLIDSAEVIQKEKSNSLPVIGTVANFRPQKDHETLLKAFNILCKSGLKSELWIIGDGPTRPSMEKLANELGIESSVRFFGTLSNPSETFRKFDVLYFQLIMKDILVGSTGSDEFWNSNCCNKNFQHTRSDN